MKSHTYKIDGKYPYIDLRTGYVDLLQRQSRSPNRVLLTAELVIDTMQSYYGYSIFPQPLPWGGGSYVSIIDNVIVYWHLLTAYDDGCTSFLQVWYTDRWKRGCGCGNWRPPIQYCLGDSTDNDLWDRFRRNVKQLSGDDYNDIRKRYLSYIQVISSEAF